MLREMDVKEAIKQVEDRLRTELNRKVEICLDELRNVPTRREFESILQEVRSAQPTTNLGRSWQPNSDGAVTREIESIKQTLESLVSSRASPAKSKPKLAVSKDKQQHKDIVRQADLIEFREEVDLKLRHIVNKFSQVTQKAT